jgi:Universal stress protein UspA and related nucleotide-binding proteins
MSDQQRGYKSILVATDFSEHANAAAKLAVWVSDQNHAQVVLANVLSDLRQAVHHSSYKARMDLLYGEGDLFEREIRRKSDAHLKGMIAELGRPERIRYETLLGEPFIEIVHAVQQEGYDLVMTGTRGLAGWQQFLVGSTAKRLIRKCPCSVWNVKAEHASPPKVVMAATDLSEVSRRAAEEALWIAERARAEFHILHIIDSTDVPPDLLEPATGDKPDRSLRQKIRAEAKERFHEFTKSLRPADVPVLSQLSWGTPWREIRRMARKLKVDLVALGTVGRSGIQGVLLGNTAEKVLTTCDASILTVKPANFVSPIQPASWPLHPGPLPANPAS